MDAKPWCFAEKALFGDAYLSKLSKAKAAALLASPDEIEQQFYEAIQQGDLERVMACWSDDEDVTCIHPGNPRISGLTAVRSSYEVLLAQGGINLQAERVRRMHMQNCAVHSVLEKVEIIDPEHGPRRAWVTATNIYMQSAQGWRLVLHHASPAVEGDIPDTTPSPSILH